MKKIIPLLIFITVQLASIAILILWIVWYVSSKRYVLALAQEHQVSTTYQTNVFWLLQGIFLMVPVIGGAVAIFIYWTKSKALDSFRVNFISRVSHELLTPLASINLYLETLLLREIDADKRQEFLKLMLEDSKRLSTMISKLLIASSIESKKAIYHFEEQDLKEAIEKFIQENPQLLNGTDIRLNMEYGHFCEMDRDSFNTLLKNLFENAIRYSTPPASISIDLNWHKNKGVLTFRDAGKGLEKKELKKIFGMFYRTTRKKTGTGLGLYIVQNIVVAHKWKVWAESEGPDLGTSFKILLPELKAKISHD